MSKDQALQVARAGVALISEHEYRQAYRRVSEALDGFWSLRLRIIEEWFREHYPELQVKVAFSGTDPGALVPNIAISPQSPSPLYNISAIFQELLAYLKGLEE
jgi:hypothetical protein